MWNANLVLALLLSKRPAPSFIVALYFPLVWLYNVLTAIKSDDVKSAFILNFQNIYNACVADSIFKHLNSLEFKALFSYFIIWPFPNALLIINKALLDTIDCTDLLSKQMMKNKSTDVHKAWKHYEKKVIWDGGTHILTLTWRWYSLYLVKYVIALIWVSWRTYQMEDLSKLMKPPVRNMLIKARRISQEGLWQWNWWYGWGGGPIKEKTNQQWGMLIKPRRTKPRIWHTTWTMMRVIQLMLRGNSKIWHGHRIEKWHQQEMYNRKKVLLFRNRRRWRTI